MSRRDYVREVDALRAPEALRRKIAALPDAPRRTHSVRPYAIVAALILVIGLGAVIPRLLTGGQLTPPPVATFTPSPTKSPFPDCVPVSQLDYAALESRMSAEEWAGFSSYFPVLREGAVFHWAEALQEGERIQDVSLEEFRRRSYGENPLPDVDSLLLTELAVCDLDGDGVQELVLSLKDLGGHYLVLHREGQEFYGVDYTIRWFEDLQRNGVHIASGGAGANTLYQLSFQNGRFERVPLGEEDWGVYRIDGKEVDEPRFRAWKEGLMVGAVNWYSPVMPLGEQRPSDTISDDELLDLLGAYAPREQGPSENTLLYRTGSSLGYTMGVLQYRLKSAQPLDSSTLVLAAFDNATRTLSGEARLFSFQDVRVHPYTTGMPEPGDDYFLCIGESVGASSAANYFKAGIYQFDGREVKPVTTSPHLELPKGMEYIFDETKNESFWQEHRIMQAVGGFELWGRNPKYYDYTPYTERPPLWLYQGYVPMAYKFPDPRAVESVRRFWEAQRSTYDVNGTTAYLTMADCTLVTEYKDSEFPNAQVYLASLRSGDHGPLEAERYFLFDESYTLLATRSVPEFALAIGGKNYPLGLAKRELLGKPSKTNMEKLSDGRYNYSEWYGADFAEGCGYTYYPETGEYRLSGINMVREDAYTARGIHMGSTVAEVIAAYPEADTEFGSQTHCLSYRSGETTLEFYFNSNGGLPEPREETLKRTITQIILASPAW